jgi:hypothetical protein
VILRTVAPGTYSDTKPIQPKSWNRQAIVRYSQFKLLHFRFMPLSKAGCRQGKQKMAGFSKKKLPGKISKRQSTNREFLILF